VPAPLGERAAVAAMVVATLLWGATFVIIRDSLATLSPAALVATRFTLAALLWGLVLAVRALAGVRVARAPARAAVAGGLVTAPLTAAGYLFQAIGLTDTSAGSSAFLTCAGTLLAGFLAWPLLGIRPPRVLVLGILLGAAGAALLGLRGDLRFGAGELWTLAGAITYALQIVVVARWIGRSSPEVLAAVQTAGTALLLLPFAPSPARLAALDPAAAAGLAYLALAGSFLAPWLQITAQRRIPPGRIGLLFALEPVFALAFALTLGGERFVVRWWIGAALILAAVLAVESRASRPATSPPASA
jgi:drug/metabolite transporter (DMT)-like permease